MDNTNNVSIELIEDVNMAMKEILEELLRYFIDNMR